MRDEPFVCWPLLIAAARYNPDPEVIGILVNAGVKLDASDELLGMTPLMWAACHTRNPEVVSALLKAGADAKARDKGGKTAFDHAKDNPRLKGTEAYWDLNNARF